MIQAGNGGSQHKAFTRILHRTQPDPLMTEVVFVAVNEMCASVVLGNGYALISSRLTCCNWRGFAVTTATAHTCTQVN